MKYLFPLLFLCAGFVMCRIAWVTFRFVSAELQTFENCECRCTDTEATSKDLRVVVSYKFAKSMASCSCLEFFAPKMRSYLSAIDTKALCETCKCTDFAELDCTNDFTLFSLFDMLTSVVIGGTFIVIMYRWAQIVKHGSHRRPTQERRERQVDRACRILEAFFQASDRRAIVDSRRNAPASDAVKLNIDAILGDIKNAKNYNTFI